MTTFISTDHCCGKTTLLLAGDSICKITDKLMTLSIPSTLLLIEEPVYDGLSYYGIAGMALLSGLMWVILMSRGEKRRMIRCAVGLIVVLTVSAVLALSGFLARFDIMPPPMMVMILGVLVGSFVLGFSPLGRDSARSIPLMALIGMQSFRLPLEVIMHHAARMGIMPEELSFTGYNFDIVTGAVALVLYATHRFSFKIPRVLCWIWNLWGMYCLVVIVIIAVTTSPMVRAFGDDPLHLNTWVLYFPYIWLPAIMVTIALSGHIIITRKLLMKSGDLTAN